MFCIALHSPNPVLAQPPTCADLYSLLLLVTCLSLLFSLFSLVSSCSMFLPHHLIASSSPPCFIFLPMSCHAQHRDFPYQSIVGSLMHTAVMMQPDITHSVQQVAQFMSNPQPAHCLAVKQILCYLHGTAGYQLTYGPDCNLKITTYCNADYANDPNTQKSISGYAFMFNGGCFTWNLRKQTSVLLSTAEAEYIATVHASKSAVWLHTLLRELHLINNSDPIDLRVDNQSAIALINLDNSVNECSKHIKVCYHWICDAIRKGLIFPLHISSDLNISNILTKPLDRNAHTRLTSALRLS